MHILTANAPNHGIDLYASEHSELELPTFTLFIDGLEAKTYYDLFTAMEAVEQMVKNGPDLSLDLDKLPRDLTTSQGRTAKVLSTRNTSTSAKYVVIVDNGSSDKFANDDEHVFYADDMGQLYNLDNRLIGERLLPPETIIREGWINVFQDSDTSYDTGTILIYENEDLARDYAHGPDYIATVKVTWQERK